MLGSRLTIMAVMLVAWSGGLSAQQQSLRPRVAPQKLTLEQLRAIPAVSQVTLKFREGSGIRYADGRLSSPPNAETTAFESTLRRIGISPADMDRLFTRPEEDLDREREEGQRRSGNQLADLNLYYMIALPPHLNAAEVANALNALDVVEFAQPVSVPPPPPIDIPPNTPDFTANQGYKDAAPQGINVPTHAEIPGSEGVYAYADLEYGWQLDHEDLELGFPDRFTSGGFISDNVSIPAKCIPKVGSTEHGTAVLGIISAKANAYGVTGIAPSSFPRVIPTECTAKTGGWSVARAIDHAVGTGVRYVLIEQQAGNVCSMPGVLGPSETNQADFDSIAKATAMGVVVVQPAGNGGFNLDSPACGGVFNLAVRDSGAIMVGAGTSTVPHNRWIGTNFGSRVDVQGWGENITTTGGADLMTAPGDARQRYQGGFDGTSGASAIVMGAVLSIEGVRRLCGLPPLKPTEMRDLLASTGTPQGNHSSGKIGPLPNIRAALAALDDVRACRPTMQVSGGDFSLSGQQGGPFGGSLRTVSSSVDKLNFAVAGLPIWLQAAPQNGTVDSTGANVTIVPTGNAWLFPPGDYGPVTINFINATNGLGNTTRTLTLRITPINDDFRYARTITPSQYVVASNVNSTIEPGEPDHGGKSGGRSVWWRLTAPTSGIARVNTCLSSFDTVLAVYTGDAVDTLTSVTVNNRSPECPLGGSAVSFGAVAGTEYYIAVDGLGGATGEVRLTVSLD